MPVLDGVESLPKHSQQDCHSHLTLPLALSRDSSDIEAMKVLTRFVTSAADPRQFPPAGAPEIAFVGRSNVGKSSLINSLVGSKIAKTSNTPGRTQTINFFQVRRPGKPQPDFVFADLPGYGYARVPQGISAQWASSSIHIWRNASRWRSAWRWWMSPFPRRISICN